MAEVNIGGGLIKGRYDRIKILGDGELTKSVTVSAHAFSKSAAEKIEKAGGTVVMLGIGSARS
jgi:large subunit ribosomal protein L15